MWPASEMGSYCAYITGIRAKSRASTIWICAQYHTNRCGLHLILVALHWSLAAIASNLCPYKTIRLGRASLRDSRRELYKAR